jgi:hypothetical protein
MRTHSRKPGTLDDAAVSKSINLTFVKSEGWQFVKKALCIVAVVAGYSFLEVVLLLCAITPGILYTNRLQIAVPAMCFAQFFLIPGLAAVISLISYGTHRWIRRTVIYLVAGIIGTPVLIFAVGAIGASLVWAFGISIALFIPLLLLIVAGFASGLSIAVRRAGIRSVQLESKRWLAERQSGIGPRERKLHNRAIHCSLAIPTLTVLVIFLFLPEIWGVFSHLVQPGMNKLNGYSVPVPLTWIEQIHDNRPEDGESVVRGLAGQGIGLGVRPYLHRDITLSSWLVGTDPYDPSKEYVVPRQIPDEDRVTARHAVTPNLTCIEYCPWYVSAAGCEGYTPTVSIECSGPTRLRANFHGERLHVPAFYKMLNGIVEVK